jgi:hypothetical protein
VCGKKRHEAAHIIDLAVVFQHRFFGARLFKGLGVFCKRPGYAMRGDDVCPHFHRQWHLKQRSEPWLADDGRCAFGIAQ